MDFPPPPKPPISLLSGQVVVGPPVEQQRDAPSEHRGSTLEGTQRHGDTHGASETFRQ